MAMGVKRCLLADRNFINRKYFSLEMQDRGHFVRPFLDRMMAALDSQSPGSRMHVRTSWKAARILHWMREGIRRLY